MNFSRGIWDKSGLLNSQAFDIFLWFGAGSKARGGGGVEINPYAHALRSTAVLMFNGHFKSGAKIVVTLKPLGRNCLH